MYRFAGLRGRLLSVVVLSATAHAATVSVVAPSVASPPDSFEITINVDSAIAVSGYFFDVSYDETILECTSVANGALPLAEAWGTTTSNIDQGTGNVTVADFNAGDPITGSGVLATMQFAMLEGPRNGQSAALAFVEAELNDVNLQPTSTGDSVAVLDPVVVSVSPAFSQHLPGDDFIVQIRVDAGSNVLGYVAELSWDPDVLELTAPPVFARGDLTMQWPDPTNNPSVPT